MSKFKTLILCILIPLLTGILSALISNESMQVFSQINKPPLSPPGFLFPIVWTILYILMGIASYIVVISNDHRTDSALRVYGLQLFFNFFWSIFFFNLEWYLFSFLWLIVLWLLILLTIIRFSQINKTAGLLMIPYLLWVSFAGYLNLGIYLLN